MIRDGVCFDATFGFGAGRCSCPRPLPPSTQPESYLLLAPRSVRSLAAGNLFRILTNASFYLIYSLGILSTPLSTLFLNLSLSISHGCSQELSIWKTSSCISARLPQRGRWEAQTAFKIKDRSHFRCCTGLNTIIIPGGFLSPVTERGKRTRVSSGS